MHHTIETIFSIYHEELKKYNFASFEDLAESINKISIGITKNKVNNCIKYC